jgi:hypothetical protein
MNDGRSFESYVQFVFSSLLNMKDEGVVVGRDVQLVDKFGIRVNSINAGGTETEGAHVLRIMGSDFQKHLVAQTPLGRFGRSSDIAPIAVFFLA